MRLTREKKSAINRRNAQKSTGPKTAEGKKRSSLSALRHGMTGQIVVMPNEDMTAYQAFLKRFVDAHKPQGPDEEQCVQVMADSSWKVNRGKAWADTSRPSNPNTKTSIYPTPTGRNSTPLSPSPPPSRASPKTWPTCPRTSSASGRCTSAPATACACSRRNAANASSRPAARTPPSRRRRKAKRRRLPHARTLQPGNGWLRFFK